MVTGQPCEINYSDRFLGMPLTIPTEMNTLTELNTLAAFVLADAPCFCVGVGHDMAPICPAGTKGLLKKMFSFVRSVVAGCEFVSSGS